MQEFLGRSSQLQEQRTCPRKNVSHVLEECQPITWLSSERPNASFSTVLSVLNNLPPHDECLRFACLADLKPDPNYGLKITYGEAEQGCAGCAVVLIESTRASNTTACGDGFKVVTEGVRDAAKEDSNATAYTIVGYGSIDGVVKLDPPRSKKSRYAIVVIDQMEGNTVQMQAAEYVEHADATQAIECFKRLRGLCRQIRAQGTQKRGHSHFADFCVSPMDMKKCKTLSAMPSDASLPDV